MISATYFGEITELDSRAVWYSDEEDEDDENDLIQPSSNTSPNMKSLEPPTHDMIRSSIQLYFRKADDTQYKFSSCIISLTSQSQFNNLQSESMTQIGQFDDYGRAFVSTLNRDSNENLLWLVFLSSSPNISGCKVGYFVEALRGSLQGVFKLDDATIFIVSQQFSNGEELEYLTAYSSPGKSIVKTSLAFEGLPMQPPSLIRNHFEASLFEQLTIALKPVILICLPNPINYVFNKAKNWPNIPREITDIRLKDDSLEKTLIFT